MDLNSLLQSNNIWLVVAGIVITLAGQWLKNKVSPTPTPAPVPGPAPDPNNPAPAKPTFLQALLAFLEQLALSKAKATASPPAANVAARGTNIDEQAAMHLLDIIGLNPDAVPVVPKP